jgi:HD-like signal output (HDOD) protein
MGWIGKLLGGSNEKNNPAVEDLPPPESELVPVSTEEIDAIYYRWLTGANLQQAPAENELQILNELGRLAQAPLAAAALVPRVPEIIPHLMRTLRDENMNIADLSRQLAQDVVLVAEVYREANRPCYRPRYNSSPPINSIESAIMLLGQNGMRMLLARVAFRPVMSMQSGGLAKQAAPLIWRQSEKCAEASSMLAVTMRANAFEAYLAGLMKNVGLVVAFCLIDQMPSDNTLPQSDNFIRDLFAQSRTLSARIAEFWEFPETVTSAIEHAGQPESSQLAETLALSDRVSKLRMLADAMQFAPDAASMLAGLDEAALACFNKLEDETD